MSNIIDFEKEWEAFVDSELVSLGYKNLGNDLQMKTIQLFTVMERRVDSQVRQVNISQELSQRNNHDINIVKTKIEQGLDVNPHLSKTLDNIDFKDMLLNDWGIHHFHLGQNMQSSGFMDRTGDVLFAIISKSSAYFIDVMPHNNWSEVNLLEIIQANWPNLFDSKEVKSMRLSWTVKTNEEVAKLRKERVNYALELSNGRVIMPSTLGYALSGHTMTSVTNAQGYLFRKIKGAQSQYEKNIKLISSKLINEHGFQKSEPFVFVPEFYTDKIYVREKDSTVSFCLA